MLNREAVTHSLICSGEMLRLRPEFAGLHASNWFHDPRLATVSPHLAFFNQILEEVGALRRKVDTPPVAIEQALQVSKTRRRLYEAGEYTPQNYEVFYPREPLIRWTDRYRQT